MKLSDYQAHRLLTLLQSTLEGDMVGSLCYNFEVRTKLLNEIVGQQDKTVIDLGNLKVNRRSHVGK